MRYSKKEREAYNKHREHVSKELGLDKNKYNALRRVGQALSKADTNYANGTTGGEPKYQGNKILNRYEDKEHTKDVNSAFSKTKAIRKQVKDLHFHHQTDPRGAALYAAKKRIKGGNYHSEGHVIY